MVRSIYLKPRAPGFGLHSFYADLFSSPVPGWRFTTQINSGGYSGSKLGILRQFHVVLQKSPAFWNFSNSVSPALEIMAFPYTSRAMRLERDCDLTYCANHLQTRSLRWVADCEHIAAMTGYYDPGVATHWLIRRFLNPSCKGLYFWSRIAKRNALRTIGADFPEDKSHVLYPATSASPNLRSRTNFDGNIRILHMTTHRNSMLENLSNFYVKGTRDFLLLLKLMSRELPKLVERIEVTIRGWSPPSYISKLKTMGVKIRVIDNPIPRAEALSHLENSDLVYMPCHSTPTMAFIEAMSRGVPVVTNDVWANSEYVLDEKTGVLVSPPSGVNYQDNYLTPLWYRPGFMRSVTSLDSGYLRRHLRILSDLLYDESHLLSLKSRTEEEFASSPFDVHRRNKSLSIMLEKTLS